MYKSRKKHWKGLLSCLLAFFMAMAVFSVTASAEETSVDTWDGTADTTWYNDTDTEFHLTTAEQLAGLAEIVNNGNTMEGKTIFLENDLDLAGQEWTSIGNGNNVSNYFAGNFNGQYHSVFNMKTGATHHGLFGIVFDGTVQNLGVENADVTYAEEDTFIRAGILMDWAHNADIRNCYTTGKITTNASGGKDIGGLVGQGMYGTQIIGCYSSAVIESKAYDAAEAIGGLVGSWETKGEQPLISDCYFDGEIIFSGGPVDTEDPSADSGMTTNVGGILGMCFDNEPDLIIKNCMVATEKVQAPSDINIDVGNGGMWIAWYQATGMPENCYWPVDDREWPACIAFETYILSSFTDGLYFDECGTATADFLDPSILQGLQENAEEGVIWVEGIDHPTFAWDEQNIPADYEAVETAIGKIPGDLTVYTDETVSALNELKNGIDWNLSLADQSQVDAIAQAIEDAVAALEYKGADYQAVDAAIAKAQALDPNEYQDFSGVEAAIAAVERGMNITQQAEVDAMAQAIEDAVAALEYKGADYQAVDAAIAKAEALNPEDYQDFSQVEAAIATVDRGKNITQQAEVDAMAQAIEDAIAALEEKPAAEQPVAEEPAPVTGESRDMDFWFFMTVTAGALMVGALLYGKRRKPNR